MADRALGVLWYASGKLPDNVPFPLLPIEQLEVDHREYLGVDPYAYPIGESDWTKLVGKDAFRQAISWFPTFEHDTDTFYLLEKALAAPSDLAPYEISKALTMAAEIAARQGALFQARQLIKKWGDTVSQPVSTQELSILAQHRHLAPLILQGILARTLRLTKEKGKRIVEEVAHALEQRIRVGRSLVYADWSWHELLHYLSDLSISHYAEDFSPQERAAQWIGRDKASEEAIRATERRLDLTLPDDYKDFLRTSNGLSAFPLVNPSLMPVEEIDWYKHLEEPELYEITRTYPDVETEADTIEPYTERALLISHVPDEQMVWLIPPLEKGEGWQTWFFASWLPGERRYPSFRHFMEACVLSLEEQGDVMG